jgi:hypothetical protein
MEDILKTIVLFVVACFAFALFFGLPVMWLWNYSLVGSVDGIHPINFQKALGITVLIALLTYKPQQTTDKE